MKIDVAIGLFIISYLVQLLLCFKAKSRQIKLIPFYFGIAVAFLGLLVYGGLFGDMSGGFLGNVHILAAIIIWIAVLIIYAALLLAEITYLVVRSIKKVKDENA